MRLRPPSAGSVCVRGIASPVPCLLGQSKYRKTLQFSETPPGGVRVPSARFLKNQGGNEQAKPVAMLTPPLSSQLLVRRHDEIATWPGSKVARYGCFHMDSGFHWVSVDQSSLAAHDKPSLCGFRPSSLRSIVVHFLPLAKPSGTHGYLPAVRRRVPAVFCRLGASLVYGEPEVSVLQEWDATKGEFASR